MPTLNIFLNVEEEAFIRQRMEAAGDAKVGPHIKRVYFANLNGNEGPLGALKATNDLILDMVSAIATRPDQVEEGRNIELRMLAGIYLMLHMASDNSARAVIDRHIDKTAIERYLTGP